MLRAYQLLQLPLLLPLRPLLLQLPYDATQLVVFSPTSALVVRLPVRSFDASAYLSDVRVQLYLYHVFQVMRNISIHVLNTMVL